MCALNTGFFDKSNCYSILIFLYGNEPCKKNRLKTLNQTLSYHGKKCINEVVIISIPLLN